jgi:Protein involved in formate dehydrogenase formation
MAAPGVRQATSPWAAHRRRAETLRERHPFAGEVLTLYLALLEVWTRAFQAARDEAPAAGALAGWAAERVLPRVVQATAEAGPEPLAEAAGAFLEEGGAARPLAAWLAGEELEPVERYLARACLRAPLEALGGAAAFAGDPAPRGGRRCPACGGPPQLSFRGDAQDQLVSGRRQLACARCAASWNWSSSACASCGESGGARRTIYAERREGTVVGRATATAGAPAGGPMFPHLRIEACDTCKRYLIDVDMGSDARAVPEVDELAALPLDLYAAEHGLSKITPNLMGF